MESETTPDTVVKSNSTTTLGKVEGGLRVGANARLRAADGKTIVVTERAYFEGPVTIDCGFECESMRVEGRGFGPGGDIKIHGDLTVHGDADITAHMEVFGDVKSENLDVSGHLKTSSLTSKRVRVGGHARIDGRLDAEAVDIGGHFSVVGTVRLASLDVGGHAEVGGGTISGNVKVMGHFESTAKLTYGELNVLGHIILPAGSVGERLSIHGDVRFKGDTSCKDIKITGVAKVSGNCVAETAEVFGKFEVSGSLKVSKGLRVFGSTEVKQQITCEELLLGGRLAAGSILVDTRADLAGDLDTTRGLKAKSVVVGKWSRTRGPIVGDEVSIGKRIDLDVGPWGYLWSGKWLHAGRMTRVEDVYGKSIEVEAYCRAERLFADVIRMDEGSMAEQVTYTSDLKLPGKYHLNEPPVKVAKLPNPPL